MNFNDNGIEGFDVSFYQDDNLTPQGVDFAKMKAWGADFVIAALGVGGTYATQTNLSSTIPMTWANTDQIHTHNRYRI